MNDIFKVLIASLFVMVSANAGSCTQEQIGAMIKNGLTQKQIDNICKNKTKVEKSGGDTIININNSPTNTNTNTNENTNKGSLASLDNKKSGRKGLYIGGNIGSVNISKDDATMTDNSNVEANLKFKGGDFSSFLVGFQINDHFSIEYERVSYENKLKSLSLRGVDLNYDGQIEVSANFINANFIFGNYNGVAPYIGLGIGQANVDLNFKQNGGASIIKFDDKVSSLMLNLGVDLYINDNVAIGLAIKSIGYAEDSIEPKDETDDKFTTEELGAAGFVVGARIKF